MSNSSILEHPGLPRRDAGFTLVEMLIVIVILGIISTVVVFSVRAIVDRGEDSACRTDHRILTEAVDAYFGENRTDVVPATGGAADPERFERTIVETGRLGEFSRLYNVNADGTLTAIDPSCI